MNFLEALKSAAKLSELDATAFPRRIRVQLITNFTDDLFKKLLIGLCLAENIYPEVTCVPYKQYQFSLKDPSSELYQQPSDIAFIFFDAHPYKQGEFWDLAHGQEILADIQRFCEHRSINVVMQTFVEPLHTTHGNLRAHNSLIQTIQTVNNRLHELSQQLPNLFVSETELIVREIGEQNYRDLRGVYAFDQPFQHLFIERLCKEWMAYIRARLGATKKCIVVDLDNTLWGGVVGELGPQQIALGPDYPGNAFQEFQRTLLGFYERGIILAINSRNNLADVEEVFQTNPHMLLKPTHFASMMINWKTKAENLIQIAEELNINLDSLVFIDDDPLNRSLVQHQLPQVCVPDFSLPPEEYVQTLLKLDAFHQLQLTREDLERGKMYADERQRKTLKQDTGSLEDYIRKLDIKLDISVNHKPLLERLTQLTVKTNQFNLTTRRYTEQEVLQYMESGWVFAGHVHDTFGDYGITLEAIIKPLAAGQAELDTFLMSCRVMGRRLEDVFLYIIIQELQRRGIKELIASFVPSAKNKPSELFLEHMHFGTLQKRSDGATTYYIDIAEYLTNHPHPTQDLIRITNPSL